MPYINVKCSLCGKENAYELNELEENQDGYKGLLGPSPEEAQEYKVLCRHCGKFFKLTLKRKQSNGQQ